MTEAQAAKAVNEAANQVAEKVSAAGAFMSHPRPGLDNIGPPRVTPRDSAGLPRRCTLCGHHMRLRERIWRPQALDNARPVQHSGVTACPHRSPQRRAS